jgi:hypothetical protein
MAKKRKLDRVMEAFYNAGAPAEGVVVDGKRYTPLNFGEEWRRKRESEMVAARPAPTKPRKKAAR